MGVPAVFISGMGGANALRPPRTKPPLIGCIPLNPTLDPGRLNEVVILGVVVAVAAAAVVVVVVVATVVAVVIAGVVAEGELSE